MSKWVFCALAAWSVSFSASGCARCSADGAVAELTAMQGSVDADDASAPVAFAPTQIGRRFVVGEALRTAIDATAELSLRGGGTLHVEPESIVRFTRDASSANSRLDVEQGSTTIEAPADAPLEIETIFGIAHLDAHTRTRIGPAASRFEVVVGHATIDRAAGAPIVLEVGGSVDVMGQTPTPSIVTPPPSSTISEPRPVLAAVELRRSIVVHGDGAHVRARGASEFAALAVGPSDVSEGSTLRTERGTTIDIATADGHVRMESDSEVQLVGGGTRAARGSFGLEGGARTRLEVPGGAIVLDDASSARVELGVSGETTVSVLSGGAVEESTSGAHVRHGPPIGEASDVAQTAIATEDLTASVVLAAGESAIVHDPSAPTRLRIDAPATCGTATWRIDARAHPASSDGALALELRAGAHRYELRCSSGVRERGDVRVDRDRGIAAMPRTAPRTIVDTDGRPYSVLYQTLLPEILVRWPHAPASGPFALEVQHAGATRTLASPNASHQFASGDFVEGTHTLAFRAADGSRSPPTTLTIHFDNATPIASIRAPAIGVALVGTAHVEGTVAEGAHVSVAGTPIPIDHAERFASDVPVPADGCIAIRVALAGRSVHYYVRCAGAR